MSTERAIVRVIRQGAFFFRFFLACWLAGRINIRAKA
jgi:hypothetical protein